MSTKAMPSRCEAFLWALVTISEPGMYISLAEASYQARVWLLTPETVNYSRLFQGIAFSLAFAAVRWHKRIARPAAAPTASRLGA